MKAVLLIASLCFVSLPETHGQDINTFTIQWVSNETFESAVGVRTDEMTTLSLFGRNKLQWKDDQGNIRMNFKVTEIVNEWSSLGIGEVMEIAIVNDTDSGSVTITKKATGATAVITLARVEPVSYELNILSSN